MKANKLINKVHKKKRDGKCYFCGNDEACLLDCHRIIEGANGGRYTEFNTLVTCVACHRKIHSDKIKIHGKHFSSTGRYVLHFTDEEGKEVWR